MNLPWWLNPWRERFNRSAAERALVEKARQLDVIRKQLADVLAFCDHDTRASCRLTPEERAEAFISRVARARFDDARNAVVIDATFCVSMSDVVGRPTTEAQIALAHIIGARMAELVRRP